MNIHVKHFLIIYVLNIKEIYRLPVASALNFWNKISYLPSLSIHIIRKERGEIDGQTVRKNKINSNTYYEILKTLSAS